MKQEKGITLMVLVITIIVLLILAGITISSLTNEKGIIKEARTAKELAELAALEEQVDLAIIKAEQKHRNPVLKDVIEELKNNNVISEDDQVNTETGAIKTDAGYEITGKLDDYIGKISTGDNTGNNTGDNTGDISEPSLAGDVLKTDPTATDEAAKSSYVKYNSLDCRVLYNDALHGLQIISSESLGNVTLGSDDTDVTSSDITYDGPNSVDGNTLKAAASYNNAINNLNKKAKSCMDSKGIASDARCLGSVSILSSDSKFFRDGLL